MSKRIFSTLLCTAALLLVTSCGRSFCGHGLTIVHAESGPVSIHQMGGDIEVREAPQGADLATMGGNIHLGHVESAARLHTMGGNISVDRAGGSVVADTMGGEIRIESAYGPIQASTMGGNITARIVGASDGQRDIHLSSKGGTIRLTVPRDFPMDVHATIAYTRNSSQDFRIDEHLGLTQKMSADWEEGFGTPRKFIRAAGQVGNGHNHVTIETVNGDIILRQE